jgi:hypothetical protein
LTEGKERWLGHNPAYELATGRAEAMNDKPVGCPGASRE